MKNKIIVTWMYWSKIATIVYDWITIYYCPGNHFFIFRPHYVIFPTLVQVWTVIVFKSGMIKWHILSDPGSRMHKMFLYFIYSSIWYITYVAYVHVREYSLTKDLHPPTEISSERQDISEKKKHNILYKPSASSLIQFTMTSLETGVKKTGGRNL